MSIIKQLATYDGSTWTTDDIGANASNVSLTTNVAGQTNVQSALSKIVGTSALTADRAVITGTGGVLSTSTVTNTELSYLSGATSNIQTQIDTLNNNLVTTNNNLDGIQEFFNRNEHPTYTNSLFLKHNDIDASKSDNNITENKYINIIMKDGEERYLSAFYNSTQTNGNVITACYSRNYNTSGDPRGECKITLLSQKDNNSAIQMETNRFYINSKYPFSVANFSKEVTVAANGWSGAQNISFTVPSGYVALPGTCYSNNGYVILYNGYWLKGDTSAAFSLHNISSSSVTVTVWARVIFVAQELISSV